MYIGIPGPLTLATPSHGRELDFAEDLFTVAVVKVGEDG